MRKKRTRLVTLLEIMNPRLAPNKSDAAFISVGSVMCSIQRAIVNGCRCSTRTCFTGRLLYIAAIPDLYLNCTDRGSFNLVVISKT